MKIASKTILNYLKDNLEPISRKNFNEVDALIFAELSYYKYENYIRKFKVILENTFLKFELLNNPQNINSLLTKGSIRNDKKKMLILVLNSPRFKNMKFGYFSKVTSKESTTQFAAISFIINDLNIVSYRGTDATLNGWHEDLNLALDKSLNCHTLGIKYLKELSKIFKNHIYVVGHSKGGNIAQHSCVFSSKTIKRKIIKCYNFDGPGFYDKPQEVKEFNEFNNKIVKLIPKESFIGTMLNNNPNYEVIKSNNKSIKQHNPFEWVIDKTKFSREKAQSYYTIAISNSLTETLNEFTKEEKEKIFTTLFKVFEDTNIKTIGEIKTKVITHPALFYQSIEQTDDEDKKLLKQFLNNIRIKMAKYFIQNINPLSKIKTNKHTDFKQNELIKKD